MLYPLKFIPIYKERIWGGQNMEKYLNRNLEPLKKIGESWDISDRNEDCSIISNGEFAGKSLRWLMENYRKELMGEHEYSKFPLLYKYIDANNDLSVQVHPDDTYADSYKLGEPGKTEAWYIVHAEPEAKLIAGLKKVVSKKEFNASMKNNTLIEKLHEIRVKNGDVLFIPSGRLHAIMKGVVLNEIQQNSDITFRVYDWGRTGFDGNPRPLHIKEALEVVDFKDYEPELVKKKWLAKCGNSYAKIINCRYFTIEEYRLKTEIKLKCNGNFKGISILEGSFRIKYKDGAIDCVKGESVLIPTEIEKYCIIPDSETIILISCAK
jgi:mannose-6-phosphate isomerase